MINETVRVLIAGEGEGAARAGEFAEIYSRIFKVAYDGRQTGYDAAMERAKKENMTHMLYFLDETSLLLCSLCDETGGYTLEATVDDLKKVLSQNAHDSL